MLNATHGIPTRAGVTHVTPFVGPGMRTPDVSYLPARLSHVPTLLEQRFVPDIVLVTVAEQIDGRWSLGCEVNILPAAISVCRAAGGLVLAESRTDMPFTYGDSELDADDIDGVLIASSAQPGHASAPAASSEAIDLIGGTSRHGWIPVPRSNWVSAPSPTRSCRDSRPVAASVCGVRWSLTGSWTSTTLAPWTARDRWWRRSPWVDLR